jgi:hypothetical protein
MAIITRKHALSLIRARKAVANGYTVGAGRDPEYVIVDRIDLQRVDHYRVTPADARLLRRLGAQ